MEIIFEVLEKCHDFIKYYGFEKLSDVWIQTL